MGPRARGDTGSHGHQGGQRPNQRVWGPRGERQAAPEGRANLMGLFRHHQTGQEAGWQSQLQPGSTVNPELQE